MVPFLLLYTLCAVDSSPHITAILSLGGFSIVDALLEIIVVIEPGRNRISAEYPTF